MKIENGKLKIKVSAKPTDLKNWKAYFSAPSDEGAGEPFTARLRERKTLNFTTPQSLKRHRYGGRLPLSLRDISLTL